MQIKHCPQISWADLSTDEEKFKALINICNWLSLQMSKGKVPGNKKELETRLKESENRMTLPLSIAFVKMAENGDIDEVTASENANMFLNWDENSSFNIGSLRTRFIDEQLKLYKCLQTHTGQVGWEPENAPTLWKLVGVDETGITVWSQPISSVDAYMKDDEVKYNGVHYRSLIDNNVWSPEAYPQGWEVVENEDN